ncbi:MAG TPA: UdgX family uracil-DNA binding protein [Casimicrobiaceae bacterium]|nr:UdgX family uracil-DNA binding protein [Casimicrobiaceae bacterium]
MAKQPADRASEAMADEHALPSKRDIDRCRRCPLWKDATQGVPGQGPPSARILLVGEQPGDEEDQQGEPFVGPAGRLLRRALDDAKLAASEIFLTNAVKHFGWIPRGPRRIHKTPTQREIAACLDWLEAEIAALRPRVIVALGATALSALMGKRTTIREARAASLRHGSGAVIIASYHPSAALRAPDEAMQREIYQALLADLVRARQLLASDDLQTTV